MEQGSPEQERRVVGVGRHDQPRPLVLRRLPDGRIHLQAGADEPVILTEDGLAQLRNHTIALLPATWSTAAVDPEQAFSSDLHGFGDSPRGRR